MKQIKRFMKEEEGLELTEYAIMAALVVGGIIIAVTALGTNISARLNWLAEQVGL